MVSLNREQVARASRASVGDLRPLCKKNCLLLPWRLSREMGEEGVSLFDSGCFRLQTMGGAFNLETVKGPRKGFNDAQRCCEG